MATYEEILSELGALIDLELKPDDNNTCLLVLEEDGLRLFLEPDSQTDDLIVGIPLGDIAPGKGAEALFTAALVTNGLHRPFLGRFAYSVPTNHLILFERAPMPYINGQMTLDLILPLIEEARRWTDAIRSGRTPDIKK